MMRLDIKSKTGFLVRFESEDLSENVQDSTNQIGALLPGVEILEVSSEIPDVTVEFVESESRGLKQSENRITIRDIWNRKISLDLWHLMYSIIRADFLSRHLYPVHSACVGMEKMVLLVGHSGTGKTTVMMKLISDFGCKVFSGNRTVIELSSGVNAIAGTKAITIKSNDLEKYPSLQGSAKSFADRATLTLDKKYFETREKMPIVAICNIKMEPGADRQVLLKHPSSLHTMFPYFLDTVYADTVMCDGNAVYHREINIDVKEKLALSLKNELLHIPVYNMAGSAEYLAKEINQLI